MFFAHLLSAPPRNCAHLPLRGRLPGRGILAMSPGRRICASAAPRNCPHFLSKIFGNLAKFSEFFRNSVSPDEAARAAIIPESPESARTADAGKCAFVSTGRGGNRPTDEGGVILSI